MKLLGNVVVLLIGALAIMVTVSLSACAMGSSYGTKMSSADVQRIVKGRTTRAEVISQFGPPTLTIPSPSGGETLMFTYSSSSTTLSPQNFIPIVGAFAGGADTSRQTQTLTVQISKKGVVEDYSHKDSTQGHRIQMHGPFQRSITPR